MGVETSPKIIEQGGGSRVHIPQQPRRGAEARDEPLELRDGARLSGHAERLDRPLEDVELRFDDGRVKTIPFLRLPLSKLPGDFFPLTCRTCVDYSNTLADITVGYMAGEGRQWLIVRNARGQELLDLLGEEVTLEALGSAGKRHASVKGFAGNVARAAGGLPLRAMPDWLRPLMGWLMPKIGPRGLEFARTRIEMKAIETVLHLRRAQPRKLRAMVPAHIWPLVAPYGLSPAEDETPRRLPPAAPD